MNIHSSASISVCTDHLLDHISDDLFGLHIEHIWNCIYDCIWVGPDSSLPNIKGLRKEVVERLSEIRPAVLKYPGGYFCDTYDWRDGIGPRAKRTRRPCPTQIGRIESNQFGTGEFLALSRLIGAEPYIAVNTVSTDASVAAQWVEYCNGTEDTYWANCRREDGHEHPFNVRYWAIGNEPYWMHSPQEYAQRYRRWVHAMYNVDPTITVVAGGLEPGSNIDEPWNLDGKWAECFLESTRAASGFFSAPWHLNPEDRKICYSFHPYFDCPTALCSIDQYYAALKELRTRLPSSIEKSVKLLNETRSTFPAPKLCFDEYGLIFDGIRMDGNMTQPAPFWSALWLAEFFHICFEHAGNIAIATHPGVINMEHELLLVEDQKVITTPSYHLFKLFRHHGGADRVECVVESTPICDSLKQTPLSCLASRKCNGNSITLSVVNLDLSRSIHSSINFRGDHIVQALASVLSCTDIHACNSVSCPERVNPEMVAVTVRDSMIEHEFPAHSVTVFHVQMSGER